MKLPYFLLSLAAALPGQDSGGFEGKVTNGVTHQPIAGARVSFRFTSPGKAVDGEAITDASGAYRFGPLAPGDYAPSFRSDGYAGVSPAVTHISNRVEKLDVELMPAATVRG